MLNNNRNRRYPKLATIARRQKVALVEDTLVGATFFISAVFFALYAIL